LFRHLIPTLVRTLLGLNAQRVDVVLQPAQASPCFPEIFFPHSGAQCVEDRALPLLFQLLAKPLSGMFLSTSAGDAQAALLTIGYAAIFLRIRCLASPVQLLNYHTSYCMQATGDGKGTMIHAIVRELVFYIPFMFILDALFGENGLASALVIGEGCGAVFALWMLRRSLRRR